MHPGARNDKGLPERKQHHLMLCYPVHTAFYILPLFRSPDELETAQRDLMDAKSFLRNFLAIAANPALPADANLIEYYVPRQKGRIDEGDCEQTCKIQRQF
jgi:hypothetical protein